MLNTIRMDLYRLFKSKSFYVTMIILVIMMFFSVTSMTMDFSELEEKVQQTSTENDLNDLDIGIQMGTTLGISGEDITLEQALQMQFASCTILVLGAIFCVVFVTGDHTTGYIKNVISRKNYRTQASISKVVTMGVYTIIEFVVSIASLSLFLLIIFQKVNIGSFEILMQYLGVQFLAQLGLLTLCVLICNVVRSIGITMAFAICLSAGLFSIIPQLIDRFDLPFKTSNYLLSVLIRRMPLQFDGTIYFRGFMTALVSIFVYLLISTFVMKRQDIK